MEELFTHLNLRLLLCLSATNFHHRKPIDFWREKGHCTPEYLLDGVRRNPSLIASSVIERVYIFLNQSCSKYNVALRPPPPIQKERKKEGREGKKEGKNERKTKVLGQVTRVTIRRRLLV